MINKNLIEEFQGGQEQRMISNFKEVKKRMISNFKEVKNKE